MTPERWQRVQELFQSALARATSERAAFVRQACADDAALRAEVESLLASHDQLEDFLDEPLLEGTRETSVDDEAESMVGRRVGPYQILREIGRGGMGTVYLAERADGQFHKQVAIKLIKRGMDTDAIVRRFRREQQILAPLDHPNIGKLLDGGTTEEGRSYFIMDYVEGLAIDVFCDTHQLSLSERLRLFRTVCSAVQYAHQHQVVHCDLKPSNILVSDDGLPKLLDFGIAKALNPERLSPTTGSMAARRLMTPEYASPEQFGGGAVTPASDIYSLGVLLYELLTGRRPYCIGSGTPEEIERVLCEEVPEKPSAAVGRIESPSQIGKGPTERLRRQLAGDLDHIILMALRKEPSRRYASVEQFSEDIGRYLEGRPVRARKDTLAYRGGKFLQRNRASVTASLLTAVMLLALIGLGRFLPTARNRVIEKPIQSLAVLPLANLSLDPEQEYFADGMTEALITDLARISALRVISRTSAMQFKGARQPLPEIGRKLNVDAVIEGAVQRVGDRVQITVQLIHAATDQHLWTGRYERDLRDVLILQNEIAWAVAQEIKIKLTPQEQGHLARARPVNREAYQAYLLGRYFWNKRATESMQRAIACFQQAVEKDPDSALAYAGLADGYNRQAELWVSSKECFPKARAAVTKALALDDTLAEAHAALAFIKHHFEWDWPGAEREFKRAIELNPGYANNYDWYGYYLLGMGRGDEALVMRKRAQELDPLSLEIGSSLGHNFFYLRQYDRAIEEFRKVIDIDANFWLARYFLGVVYTQKGMYEAAIAELKKARQLEDNPAMLGWLGVAYARSGQREMAWKTLDELQALSERRHVRPFDVAFIYTALGYKDQAIQWLEKGFEERQAHIITVKSSPGFDDLRSDPRFAELVRRTGLSP